MGIDACTYRKLLLAFLLLVIALPACGAQEIDPAKNCPANAITVVCPDGTKLCAQDSDFQPGVNLCTKVRLARIASALTESMIRCPDRVWPGYDWRRLQVVLVESEAHAALLWNDQRKDAGDDEVKLTWMPYADLPSNYKLESGDFEFGQLHGVPTLGIGAACTDDGTIQSAIHEGFHFTGDNEFANTQNGSSRGLTYPIDYQPRYLRYHVILSLSRALFSGDSKALGAARYWYDQYLKRYPEDSKEHGALDIAEGTAQYVGLVGTALAKVGCKASEAELLSAAKEMCQPDAGEELDWVNPGDAESYQIGVIAGLLLRQRNAPQWQEHIAKGTPPLDLLLKHVKPIHQKDDKRLLARVKEFCQQRNDEIGVVVDTFFKQMGSADHFTVAVPLQWMASSFSTDGFVNTTLKGKQHNLILGMSVPLQSPDGSARGTIDGAVTELLTESPRGSEPLIVFPVTRSALQSKDRVLSIDSPGFNLSGITVEILEIGGKGAPWLFLQPYSPPSSDMRL